LLTVKVIVGSVLQSMVRLLVVWIICGSINGFR
jgi:hypothetical protein